MHHDHAVGVDLGWLTSVLPAGAAFLALPVALWLTGVLAGATHCTAMCGPFILVRSMRTGSGLPIKAVDAWSRLRIGALPAYHAGRALTYSLFGAIAGALGEGVAEVAGLGWVRATAIAAAVVMLLAPMLHPVARLPSPHRWQAAITRWAGKAALLPGRAGDVALGAAMGFLPCGMIYIALVASTAAGSALTGAVAMAAFAAGTWVPLSVVGAIGATAGRRLRHHLSRWASPLAALNLLVLGVWFVHVG
jgi:hypothetical protein